MVTHLVDLGRARFHNHEVVFLFLMLEGLSMRVFFDHTAKIV